MAQERGVELVKIVTPDHEGEVELASLCSAARLVLTEMEQTNRQASGKWECTCGRVVRAEKDADGNKVVHLTPSLEPHVVQPCQTQNSLEKDDL